MRESIKDCACAPIKFNRKSFVKKQISYLLLLLSAAFILTATPSFAAVLSLYTNGNIYALDEKSPKATDMIVDDGGVLVYVGDKRGTAAYSADITIDLKGMTVTPGMIDGHTHIALYGIKNDKNFVTIPYTTTMDELKKLLAGLTSKEPKPEYLAVSGYELPSLMPDGGLPRAADIDGCTNGVPVIVSALDGHSVWMNSAAMKDIFGYGKDNIPESIPGNCEFEYTYDASGKRNGLTGFVNEGGFFIGLNEKLPYAKQEKIKEKLPSVLDNYSSKGITAVFDAGGTLAAYHAIRELDKADMLNMYIEGCYVAGRETTPISDWLHRGKNFNVRTVKIVADGTIESKTAGIIDPYEDGTPYEPFYDEERIYQFLKEGLDNDCNLHCHAIGDKTQRYVLNVYRKLKDVKPELTRAIAHNEVNCPEAIEIYASMKDNLFYGSTPNWWSATKATLDAVGEERMQNNLYLMKQAIDKGVKASINDDFPANIPNSFNPMLQIHCAVKREKGVKDVIEGEPEEITYIGPAGSKLTREEALKAYTVWPAEQLGIADKTGSLKAGKNADFVIWSEDFMDEKKCSVDDIKNVKAENTFFRGKEVYKFNDVKEEN